LGKAETLRRKPVPVPLAPPKLTWTDLRAKPGLCYDRMVTKCVSHETVILATRPLKYFLYAIKLIHTFTITGCIKWSVKL